MIIICTKCKRAYIAVDEKHEAQIRKTIMELTDTRIIPDINDLTQCRICKNNKFTPLNWGDLSNRNIMTQLKEPLTYILINTTKLKINKTLYYTSENIKKHKNDY